MKKRKTWDAGLLDINPFHMAYSLVLSHGHASDDNLPDCRLVWMVAPIVNGNKFTSACRRGFDSACRGQLARPTRPDSYGHSAELEMLLTGHRAFTKFAPHTSLVEITGDSW
jgi:hypothetical protein